MAFPYVSAATGGLILVLQMLLAIMVSASRGKTATSIGDAGKLAMLRPMRRHGNLAENAGLFLGALLLFELAHPSSSAVLWACGAFAVARLMHAIGLSLSNTDNAFRLAGAGGTYLLGLILGASLLWTAVPMILSPVMTK